MQNVRWDRACDSSRAGPHGWLSANRFFLQKNIPEPFTRRDRYSWYCSAEKVARELEWRVLVERVSIVESPKEEISLAPRNLTLWRSFRLACARGLSRYEGNVMCFELSPFLFFHRTALVPLGRRN